MPFPAPRRPRSGGRKVLLVLLVLVLLLCGGVPGAIGLYYLSLQTGPYESVPSPCGLFNTEIGKSFTSDLAGEPEVASVTDFIAACTWSTDGSFRSHLQIWIYSRKPIESSEDRARKGYKFAKETDGDFSRDADIYLQRPLFVGDEAYTAIRVKDTQVRFKISARVDNATIDIERTQFSASKVEVGPQQAEEQLRQFEELAKQLFRDVAEHLD